MNADQRGVSKTFASVPAIGLAALGLLFCCSCRSPVQTASSTVPSPALRQESFAGVPAGYVTTAETAATAGPQAYPVAMAVATCAANAPAVVPGPMPSVVTGPWAPPGFGQPWPPQEYLCDGGDQEPAAAVKPDWQVRGLNLEDTVAHYDTLSGETVVEPSNRVCIYSPRFAAVRQVVSLRQNDQMMGTSGVHQPLGLVQNEDVARPGTSKQQIQAEAQRGERLPNAFRMREGSGIASAELGPRGFDQNMFKPYENLSAIRLGRVEEAETAWLARSAAAAVAWSHTQAVQVILDSQIAAEEVSDRRAVTVYSVNEAPAQPRLRLIKVASTLSANPGETVDFTLRFDNVGNQPIGNVTILDNLTTRLEYEPDSAQCSVEANFQTQPNQGESLALRWEIVKPLKPGDGGIIRFRCRVR